MKLKKRIGCLLTAFAVTASALTMTAEPAAVQAAEAEDILENGGFETGNAAPWEGKDGAVISVSDADPYEGSYCLKVSERTGTWQGPQVKLEGLKEDQMLTVSACVKYTDGPETKKVQAALLTGSEITPLAGAELTRGEWGKIEGKLLLSDKMEGAEVRLFFETPWTPEPSETEDLMDFYVDDVTVSVKGLSDISEYPSLKELYQDAFYIGVAAPNQVLTTGAYSKLVTQQFSSMTMENEMKPAYIMDQARSQGDLNAYQERVYLNFDAYKTGMDYARENGISMRGHVLIWHSQTPDWFFYKNYDTNRELADRELMLKRMENYIKDVICWTETNYPGVIYAWDVVNEAVADPWGLGPEAGEPSPMRQADSLWYQTIGEDFVQQAFAFARKYTNEYASDHKIKLFYNDYNEYFQQKRDGIIELLRPVSEAGNLDGVGMQSHIDVDWDLYGNDGYITAMRKFSKELGVELQVTELDVGMTSEAHTEASQGAFYQKLMEALIEEKYNGVDITCVTFWGLTDALSWRPGTDCLLFRENLSRKPAFEGVVKAAELIAEKEEAKNRLAAQEVTAVIGTIGEIAYTQECRLKIDAAREAYEALTDAQKAFVTNVDVLKNAEAAYAQLEKNAAREEEDKEATKPGTDQPGTDQPSTDQPSTDQPNGSAPKEGETYTVDSYSYQVTSLADKTVAVVKTTKQSKKITVKDTVTIHGVTFQITEIAKNAFKGNKKATSAKIGKNVKMIGENAFGGCKKLARVTISSKVLSKIDKKAFYNCKKLGSVKLTSSKLKTVGKNAFKGTAKKIRMDVPNSKIKAYKKLLQKGGLSKTATVK